MLLPLKLPLLRMNEWMHTSGPSDGLATGVEMLKKTHTEKLCEECTEQSDEKSMKEKQRSLR